MPKVICKLENAADEISGVKFAAREDGFKVSEELSDEAAAVFLSIPGYELEQIDPEAEAARKAAEAEAAAKAAEEAAKKAAEAKAAAKTVKGGKKAAAEPAAPAAAPSATAEGGEGEGKDPETDETVF